MKRAEEASDTPATARHEPTQPSMRPVLSASGGPRRVRSPVAAPPRPNVTYRDQPCSWLTRAALHGDEFDVDICSLGQCPQITGVGGENVIAVCGQGHDRGVDRIGQTAAGQQHARPPPQAII